MRRFLLAFCFLLFTFIARATVYGPYNIGQNVPQPEGYTKVVVYSQPFYYGGVIRLTNVNTGEEVTLSASTSGPTIWYNYVESGTYVVTFIGLYLNVYFGAVIGTPIQIGDELNFVWSSSCCIIITPSN